MLALLAERASGVGFHELVRTLVCEPAGMVDTAFLRSDELPGRAALGYLAADGLRTNTPSSPGGSPPLTRSSRCSARTATGPRRTAGTAWASPGHATTDTAWLERYDAGVSFASVHRRESSTTCTVISSWTDGAWPVVRALSGGAW